MKIVIFGGGGFIGSSIIDRLLLDTHEITVFEQPHVRPYRSFSTGESVNWISGNLFSDDDLSSAMCGADAVIHLVSTTLPKNSNDDPIFDVQSNIVASIKILNAMVRQKISRILFISSGGTVYGGANYLPINESHNTDPQVSYGVVKLAIEKYLQIYNRMHGIKSVTLRVSNPYGERQRIQGAQGAVGVFMNKALRGEPIEIWGDGTVVRDFIYVADVAEAFSRALTYEGSKHVFNISSGIGTSINELLTMVEKVVQYKVHRKYLIARPYDVPVSILDNSLAAEELNWRPRTQLSEGILRTFLWMKDNLEKC